MFLTNSIVIFLGTPFTKISHLFRGVQIEKVPLGSSATIQMAVLGSDKDGLPNSFFSGATMLSGLFTLKSTLFVARVSLLVTTSAVDCDGQTFNPTLSTRLNYRFNTRISQTRGAWKLNPMVRFTRYDLKSSRNLTQELPRKIRES